MTIAQHLARNLLTLRRHKRWSQHQLSLRAAVPRSTIAHMESGGGNPSLSNLDAVAGALRVSIEELISPPRADAVLTTAAQIPVEKRGEARIHQLLPERVRGLEIVRMEYPPGVSIVGTPHLRGTKEYLYGLAGELAVLVAGELFVVGAGDVLAFPGDQTHSYLNRARRIAIAVSIVVPLP